MELAAAGAGRRAARAPTAAGKSISARSALGMLDPLLSDVPEDVVELTRRGLSRSSLAHGASERGRVRRGHGSMTLPARFIS